MDVTRPRATKASQITWDLAATLIASLENGGVNEISVAGLSGALADTQIPSAHKTIHQNGGSDEINVGGLSGILGENAVVTSGNYTGDDAVDRAIAHGLGRVPKHVILRGDGAPGNFDVVLIEGRATAVGTSGAYTVAAADATNFYVGVGSGTTQDETGNGDTVTYYWKAIG